MLNPDTADPRELAAALRRELLGSYTPDNSDIATPDAALVAVLRECEAGWDCVKYADKPNQHDYGCSDQATETIRAAARAWLEAGGVLEVEGR